MSDGHRTQTGTIRKSCASQTAVSVTKSQSEDLSPKVMSESWQEEISSRKGAANDGHGERSDLCLSKSSFIGTQPWSLVEVLSLAAVTRQSWVAVAGAIYPTKAKVFIMLLSTGKVCDLGLEQPVVRTRKEKKIFLFSTSHGLLN